MSGLEVVGAVAAVVSAFHGGAELVAHIKKKQRRRSSRAKSQQAIEEKLLQDSLETGETQVGLRYTQDLRDFGEIIRIGDAIARDRLLHIAVVMQAEVIKSLQLAAKHENAVLNLKMLHESSILSRKDSIVCLDELKQRILIARPLRIPSSGITGLRDTRASLESMQSFRTANIHQGSNDYLPTAVTIPEPGSSNRPKSGLSRYISMKGDSRQSTSSQQRPSSPAGNINFSPALNHLLQGNANVMKDIDEIISSYQGLYSEGDRNHTWALLHGAGANSVKRDTLAILNGGDSERRNTLFSNQDALMMLKNLPPTLKERQERSEYHSFNHRGSDPRLEQGNFQQYYTAPSPLPQRMTEQESHQARWSAASASSSIYSDTVPPSLDSHNSASDCSPRGSPSSPVIASFAGHHQQARLDAPYTPPSQAHISLDDHYTAPLQISRPGPIASCSAPPRDRSPPIAPVAGPQLIQTSPNVVAPFINPFTAPPRIRTPPIAPFVASPQSRMPVDDDNGALRAGRTRVHLGPGQLVDSSVVYGVTTSITTGSPPPTLKEEIYTLARRNETPSPNRAPVPVPVPVSYRTNSNPACQISSGTIQGPTAAQENMMDGRPCKENNYWGFCKGAWATREESRRGLGVHSVPNGMFNSTQIWQCRSCLFQGETFSGPHPTKKGKKQTIVDPHVYTSAVGIRYKWIFLAKSHVKKKNLSDTARSAITFKMEEKEECNYGCTICSVEGNVTGIYGNVETLMNHIFLEHVRTISDRTQLKTKCIVGRVADAHEEWDLNMPMTDVFLG